MRYIRLCANALCTQTSGLGKPNKCVAERPQRISTFLWLQPGIRTSNTVYEREFCNKGEKGEKRTGRNIVMLALNVWLAASVTLWVGAYREKFTYDKLTFLYDVVKEDEYWMQYLDVEVKIDPAVVSIAAKNVMQDLNLVQSAQVAHRPAPAPPNPEPVDTSRLSTSSDEKPKDGGESVVSAKALRLIVDVVTKHNKESDAIEFGMVVMTSAIKCKILPYILIQLKVIEELMDREDPETVYRPKTIWKNLVQYIDKIALLKDSLHVAAEMYHKWSIVVSQTFGATLDSITGTIGDVKPFKELLQSTLNELCVVNTVEEIEALLNFNPDVEKWDTPEGPRAIFHKCQNKLQEVFDGLPFTTMDLTLWSDYLNKPELLKTFEINFT